MRRKRKTETSRFFLLFYIPRGRDLIQYSFSISKKHETRGRSGKRSRNRGIKYPLFRVPTTIKRVFPQDVNVQLTNHPRLWKKSTRMRNGLLRRKDFFQFSTGPPEDSQDLKRERCLLNAVNKRLRQKKRQGPLLTPGAQDLYFHF